MSETPFKDFFIDCLNLLVMAAVVWGVALWFAALAVGVWQ